MTTVIAITAPLKRKSRAAKYHKEEPLIPGLAVCGRECRDRVILADPTPEMLCGHCWPGVTS